MRTLAALFLTAAFAAISVSAAEQPAAKKEAAAAAETAKPSGHDCANCPEHNKAAALKKEAAHKCPLAEKEARMGCADCGMEGAERTVANIPAGAEITMVSKDKAVVERIQKMAAEHHSGAGARKDCPCRVSGAETVVENTADGVKITITGKVPGVVKKIQQMAAKKSCGCGGRSAAGRTGHRCPNEEAKAGAAAGTAGKLN